METKLIPLISETEIQSRVKELARQISTDYQEHELLLIGVLKGSWVFLADLARNLTIPVKFDFLTVSSYGDSTITTGKVNIINELKATINQKDVLLIEDILDTGHTLKYIIDNLLLQKPRTLKLCVLLDKPERHELEMKIDYLGFTVPNKFVVGYGIDFNEQYRQLPYIAYIQKD